jgi:hypothetical protein
VAEANASAIRVSPVGRDRDVADPLWATHAHDRRRAPGHRIGSEVMPVVRESGNAEERVTGGHAVGTVRDATDDDVFSTAFDDGIEAPEQVAESYRCHTLSPRSDGRF